MLAAVNIRAGFVLTTTLLILACSSTPDSAPIETANTIHERAVVIDAHAHPKPGAEATLSLGEKTEGFELDFLTMKEGGLDAVVFSLPMPKTESTRQPPPEEILADVKALEEEVGRFGDLAEIARSPADVSRIHERGKRAILLSVEADDPIGGDVGRRPAVNHSDVVGKRVLPKRGREVLGRQPAARVRDGVGGDG